MAHEQAACRRLQAHERIVQSTTAEPIAGALRELDASLLPSLAATPAAYQLRAHALLRLNRCPPAAPATDRTPDPGNPKTLDPAPLSCVPSVCPCELKEPNRRLGVR